MLPENPDFFCMKTTKNNGSASLSRQSGQLPCYLFSRKYHNEIQHILRLAMIAILETCEISIYMCCFYLLSGFAQAWKVLEFRGRSWKSHWKLNLPWKVLENHSKALKNPWILLFSVWLITVDRNLNQYKIVVPLFGAAYAAPNIATTVLY